MKPAPGRSPEYRLIKAYDKLPAGAFIKPMQFAYLPKQRQEDFKYYDSQRTQICHTPLGFMPIPKNLIEEIP